MMNEKDKYYLQQVIEFMLNHDIISTKDLAREVGLSEKAVRNRLESIEAYILEHNYGCIRKKPRVGIWLEADEHQRVALRNQLSLSGINFLQSNEQRTMEAVRQILQNEVNGITTQKLAEEMFLSVPTVLKILKDAEVWFREYKMYLDRVRNKGIVLKGSENGYRLAVKNFITFEQKDESLCKAILSFTPGVDVDTVKVIIRDVETEWGIDFANSSYEDVLVYVCLAIFRQKKRVDISTQEVETLERYSEFSFAEAILNKVSKHFKIKFAKEEVAFLSIQILCSKQIGNIHQLASHKYVQEYDQKLELFVEKLIEIIANILNQDFSADKLLYQGLLLHLRPTIFRLRYGRTQPNVIVEQVKTEYKQVFRSLWSISVLFEEHFDVKVTEDELGYIALYIQAAIERKENPLQVVLISHFGMGHNQLIIEKIKKAYPDIKHIDIVGERDFKPSNYKHADVIITTHDHQIKDSRVIEIENFLTNEGIQKLNSRLLTIINGKRPHETAFDVKCHQLFEPDLIFMRLPFTSKESLLTHLADRLVEKGYATKKYLNSVLEREEATPTSIGNGVAIPHGSQNEVNDAKVVIATLDKPIQWNEKDKVDVVFLLAVKMNTNEEIEKAKLFYKQYISLVGTDERVDFLRNMESNISFYKYLIRTEMGDTTWN